jgi:hypothetical protein
MTAADRFDHIFMVFSLYSLAAFAILGLCYLIFRKLTRSPGKKGR